MGFILSILSSLIKWVLQPLLYSTGLIASVFSGKFNQYHLQIAVSKDRYGNVLGQYLFNLLLIKKDGYKFGNGKETISSVLGKNKKYKKFSFLGMFLDKILDLMEKDHSIKSIDEIV